MKYLLYMFFFILNHLSEGSSSELIIQGVGGISQNTGGFLFS